MVKEKSKKYLHRCACCKKNVFKKDFFYCPQCFAFLNRLNVPSLGKINLLPDIDKNKSRVGFPEG